MTRFFTLATLLVTTNLFGQFSEDFPTDGLIAWFPLEGDIQNVMNPDQVVDGMCEWTLGRSGFDEDQAALFTNPSHILNGDASGWPSTERTVSVWMNYNGNGNGYFWGYGGGGLGQCCMLYIQDDCGGSITSLSHSASSCESVTKFQLPNSFFSSWSHVVLTVSDNQRCFYVNGSVATCENTSTNAVFDGVFAIGSSIAYTGENYYHFEGALEDIGLWDRALSPEEVEILFNATNSIFGCTDPVSCNFNPEAEEDDGSCLPYDSNSGCMDSVACNYDSSAVCDDASCIYPPFNLANCDDGEVTCGAGTYWDMQSQSCVVANPSDTDFDGCVGMIDLLDLLSVFGTCVESEAEVVEWSCGDPLGYQGYDYETVQIGEQCWFAENLRSENYKNGDAIPAGLSNDEWDITFAGAVAVYDEVASNLEALGRLYNWHAVADARGFCPGGWHVPSDEEWMTLEMSLGMSEAEVNGTGGRGTNQANQMKSENNWDGEGNGTNSSGFSGLPGGYRGSNGVFYSQSSAGIWWSSSASSSDAWYRRLNSSSNEVYRWADDPQSGFSVRCIQDSE